MGAGGQAPQLPHPGGGHRRFLAREVHALRNENLTPGQR